jgi:hypothetical protein
MNEEYENGKSYLPGALLLLFVRVGRQPLSRIALPGVVQLADQQFGYVEVSSTSLLPRRCAQLQFPRDGMADVDLAEIAFVESTRSPTGIPRRWCVPFPMDEMVDVGMAGTSLVESAQCWSDHS